MLAFDLADACYEVVYSGGSQALLNIALDHAEVGTNSFAHFVAMKVAGVRSFIPCSRVSH